jgi:hypothetical protein
MRHDREEDHSRSMHREELIVEFRRHDVLIWCAELGAHDHGFDAAPDKESERSVEIENADSLVIYGGQPAPEASLLPGVFSAVCGS